MRRNLGKAFLEDIVSTTDALTTRERFRLGASTNDYGDIVGLLTKEATICQLNRGNNTVSQGAVCANCAKMPCACDTPPASLHVYLCERGVGVILGLVLR